MDLLAVVRIGIDVRLNVFIADSMRGGMRLKVRTCLALLTLTGLGGADTLGFVEQKFTDLHFERGKWTRTLQLPCYSYTAQVDGASVEVLRYGTGNLVPFRAKRGMVVTVCGSVAAFDEGFEAGPPIASKTAGH